MKVYVTAIGAVSALGLNAEENLHALQSHQTGLTRSDNYGLIMGQVNRSNDQLEAMLDLPANDHSRTTLLGLLAAREAWQNAGKHNCIRTGMISSTSVGGMDRTEQYYFDHLKNQDNAHYGKMIHDNGRTTEMMAQQLGISGYIGTISTACSSGANAIMQGARLIRANKLDRVLAGGAEPLAHFDIRGFQSLGIYDTEICKPFDDNRMGLNLGEGAAYLLLENENSIARTGSKPLCTVAGWDNATDAYHQTASSPEGKGAAIAMRNALEKAGISIHEINYVNAHGTGTGNNDLSEAMAFQAVFGKSIPPFSSTKGFTGHMLAAAGSIEAVFCVQSIKHQVVFPNLNFARPMKETGLTPVYLFRQEKVDYVLSNSFGFGGNCTCLIFGKV